MKRSFPAFSHREAALALLVSLLAGMGFYTLYGLHDPSLFVNGNNVWFQGDLPRVFQCMTDRLAEGHYRLKVHPLFSLLTFPPTLALVRLGADPFAAVRCVTAGMAALWLWSLYLLLRLIGCQRLDAVLFSTLGACSAAAVFWLTVPESYALGSISMTVALALAALAHRTILPDWAHVAASAFTLSVTVTNWMVGILGTLATNPWRRALRITLVALACVTLLWGLEKYIFPEAVFFIGDREEGAYVFRPDIERLFAVLNAFLFHSMLAPAIGVAGDNGSGWPMLSVQAAVAGSSGLPGLAGALAWAALLLLGGWALLALKTHAVLRRVLGLSILGQLALHTLYGEETFLYALHFLPLLVVLAALATLTSARLPALVLAAVLLPLVATNNWLRFEEANLLAVSPRQQVKNQMLARPEDPWPRGRGHVILALPGSEEQDKAYHEPGGSFSPGVGTFGVSIWVDDGRGRLYTGDSLAVADLTQSLAWQKEAAVPELVTDTAYYRSIWSTSGWGAWKLRLSLPDHSRAAPMLLVRSVGPAGGPIRELSWDDGRLLINKRWSLSIHPAPQAVHLGTEDVTGWMARRNTGRHVVSRSGWAYARIELGDATAWTADILDQQPGDEPPQAASPISANLDLDLPDPRFGHSLRAQIAHLMMGLVGGETRPGDPTNYPLAWQRDGAYTLAALAGAGQLEAARMLAKDHARRDFFGGFGPEADAPGLALWALGRVADQLGDAGYDRWLWPHVRRKAEYIETMLATRSPLRRKVVGPVVPGHSHDPDLTLVAEAARAGLIVGKMDHQRPLLFINAISYRGLLEAARFAERLGHAAEARRWRASAEKLQRAWERAFQPPLADNDRTYISALWPSWVASARRQPLQQRLERRWAAAHAASGAYSKPPLWTYFELAEAHQWLFVGRNDRVWTTLEWFWNHQSSPGLYTWWEGQGEENSFRRWENVRGWVHPPHVTPHYWTAAEMALLQMDMLGYVDQAAAEPVLVIGGGIPPRWLSRPMHVRGLRVGNFILDWHWDGNKIQAVLHGARPMQARLGPAFPAGTGLALAYRP